MIKSNKKRSFAFLLFSVLPGKTAGFLRLFFCSLFLLAVMNVPCAFSEGLPYFISADSSKYTSGDPLPVDAVSIFEKRNGFYLFIPTGWDCQRLRILCENGESLRLDGVPFQSGDAVSVSPDTDIEICLGQQTWTAHVVQSGSIPAVFITTDSGSNHTIFQSKENRESGACKIIQSDASVEYDGRLEYIRIRGQSTSTYEKKPFQIKLANSASVFGMEKEKKWVLLANFIDKSLIRNTIALDLARYAGVYSFVPETKPVDLFLNHQYYGSFLFTEKCEIDSDRLDIRNLENINESLNPGEDKPPFGSDKYGLGFNRGILLENEPEDYTGGYLVLMTILTYYRRNASGFISDHGQCFTIEEPERASKNEVEYIQGCIQQAEDVLFTCGPDDRTWTEYIDETTFVHRYLQAEITADNDGSHPYLYKDSDQVDSKIYFGPVWDQDNIWGANKECADPMKLYHSSAGDRDISWFPVAVRRPDFSEKVREAYREVYEPALRILLGEEKDPKGVLRSLDEYAEEIAASAALENIRWRFVPYRFGNMNQTGDKPEENFDFLRNFISMRKSFLDDLWMNAP